MNDPHPAPSEFGPRTDGQAVAPPVVLEHSRAPERMAADKVRCEACPVLCQISPGKLGACDRYGNVDGTLTRTDTVHLVRRAGQEVLEWSAAQDGGWNGTLLDDAPVFVSGIGSGTTYPDYKPAPFIVASKHQGVDMVTVVTEGIFSYCSFKVKIDTDRYLGPEQATVRHQGEAVGHVTTIEYGSQFLALGGVHHLTGGSKREGRISCELMMALGNQQAVDLQIEGGAALTVQAGRAPIVDGALERRMRVGCGSATIGIFAQQWHGHVDEVVVVDDHITGVLSEHQAGRYLDIPATGIKVKGRRSTPGRYFNVANAGTGWGGTDIEDPLTIIERFDPAVARPGLTLLMIGTTGEHHAYFVLDDELRPVPAPLPDVLRLSVARIRENCEPAMTSVLFIAGAGGSLRAGATVNPVALTRSVNQTLTRVTCGGAPVYIWPGGGITFMVDVMLVPPGAFGYVPTPALVAPLEFTLRKDDYAALGGHMEAIVPMDEILARPDVRYS